MRPSNILKGFFAFILVSGALSLMAQQPNINYFRPWDQNGVGQFETTKDEVAPYEGIKVRVGGAFTQQYQGLNHENAADETLRNLIEQRSPGKFDTTKININGLYPLGGGFNLATANLNVDVQLGDGIRLALENYMSSRHHSEFWVKGGYIQFDKLPLFGQPEFWTKYITAKVGHMEINYGDQHFRRTDNGNSFFNPFVGNTILDAFATEIGGELYFKHPSGFMAMAGVTAGLINGDVREYGDFREPVDTLAGNYTKSPSVYFKLAFDRNFSEDFRFRISGSMYNNQNTIRNTMYAGDRTGSRYYMAMEPQYTYSGVTGNSTATTAATNFTSGRFNPGLTAEITAFMVNTFIKFKGLELFGTYETTSGRAKERTENNPAVRTVSQYSVELSYRFLKNEQLFVSGRYNSAFGQLVNSIKDDDGTPSNLTVTRYAAAIGWYITPNLLAKVEYVNQDYIDFPTTDYRSGGNFNGFMIEAAVGF